MEYTGVENRPAADVPRLIVSGTDGCLRVRSTGGLISNLLVYNLSGALLHNDLRASDSYTIPLPGSRIYIMKALVNSRFLEEKVLVK
jgi:hypothetical protein